MTSRRKTNNNKGYVFKSLNQIQNGITTNKRASKPNPRTDMYLRCVFKPFESLGRGQMRPDSASNKIILRDIIQAYDINSPGLLNIKISPMYPYCISWWPTVANTTVNGITIPPAFTNLPAGFTAPAGKADTDFSGSGGIPAMVDYEKARIQTIGWRLLYTGKPVDASGYVLVDNSAFQVDVVDRQVSATSFYYTGSAGALVNYPLATSCAYANVETSIFYDGTSNKPVPPTQTSRLFRPEEGAHGILKRSAYAPNHSFKPVWNSGIAPMDHRNGDPNASGAWISSPRVGAFAGVSLIDDDFDSTMISISAGGLWRLEVVTCLEAVILPVSPLEPLAKASPALEQQTLDQEARVMASVPPASAMKQPIVPDNQLVHTPSVNEQINALAELALTKRAGKTITVTGQPVIPKSKPQPMRTPVKGPK